MSRYADKWKDNYAPGTAEDPRAPWNQTEEIEVPEEPEPPGDEYEERHIEERLNPCIPSSK